MPDSSLPDLSRDTLVDLAGWAVLKEARALVQAGAVQSVTWNAPELSAEVGSGRMRFFPRLNLRSLTFAENRCNCPTGRRGIVCSHAIAACIAIHEQPAPEAETPADPALTPKPDTEPGPAKPHRIESIRTGAEGTPLLLRFLLPPNLAEAARRDAIMTKVEVAVARELTTPEKLFRGTTYALSPSQERAYAQLEQWCRGRPGSLLQLKRAQLRTLLDELQDEPVFASVRQPDRPLPWSQGKLSGVHEHLGEPEPEPQLAQGERDRRERPAREAEAASAGIAVPRRGAARTPLVRPSAVDSMKERIAREGAPGSRLRVDGSTRFLAIELPDSENPVHEPARKLLREHEFRPEPSNGRWWLRDRHKTLNFLAAHESTLRNELGAQFTESFAQHTQQLRRVRVKTRIERTGRQFQLRVNLEAPGVEAVEIYRAVASRQHYVIKEEHIYLIAPDQLEKLTAAQQSLAGDRSRVVTPRFETRLRPAQLRDAEQVLEDLDASVTFPADWKKSSAALARLDKLEPPPLPTSLKETLRLYQQIGSAWLWHLYRHELGGILADEMGLGKTIQALGLLACARSASSDPSLVVCPASLLGNWAREAARFVPDLKVFLHHRESRLETAEQAKGYDLVLTSYPTLSRDDRIFAGRRWNVVFADEAQHIKNRRTQAAAALRRLDAHARFVLTGTPIENSLDDLRSIFDFILPSYLAKMPAGASGDDRSWYDGRHRAQAAPYILRRTKQLVAPELPPKIEQVVHCELTPRQRSLYQKVHVDTERAIGELELAGKSEAQIRIAALAQLLRLRQVCAEPRLLDRGLEPADSAKLEAFSEILDEALDGGHRILVFSQFVSVLQYLKAFLEELGLTHCYLDGSTRDRMAVVDRFNNDDSIPVFLISLKAGGVGLNLTGADTVVHFDPWWNPAVEDQATDRAHRIGQTRTVTSYKLIAAQTVEEKVLALQARKSALLRDLLEESAAATSRVALADIKALLAG